MGVQWNKVTWYSKLLAIILGLLIFLVGYCLGRQAGELKAQNNQTPTVLHFEPVANESETKKEQASILGSWKRVDLADQVVRYKPDGTAEVLYNGVVNTTFHWEILTNEDNSEIIKEEGNPDRFYKILKHDENVLEIEYQYNKRVLRYNKVKEND